MHKKLLLLYCCSLFCISTHAQKGVKLEDIIQQHELNKEKDSEADAFDFFKNREKNDYHFQRWLWQWRQHTDQDGYLVPARKALKTWQQYEASYNRAAAKTTADQSSWKTVGPFVQSGTWLGFSQIGIGRINTMAFHPTDRETFIVGTAGGGAWGTEDFGKTWEPITENLMTSGVSDIDFNPLNPNTIYICTGDKEYPAGMDIAYNSIGLIKSYDGGTTWDTTGLIADVAEKERTNSLVINPADTNSLTLATQRHILKSFDGGYNWADVTPDFGGSLRVYRIYELVYNTADTNTIYTCITVMDTSNYTFAVQFVRSTDGGMSWDVELTVPNALRGAIAVTPADPYLLKIITCNTNDGLEGIYSSNDGGINFVQVFNDNSCTSNILAGAVDGRECGGQGTYDICIAIDPNDTYHLVAGGVNSWESKDGGYSWTLMTQWADYNLGTPLVHADHHYLGYHPLADDILFDCNDGGISALMPKPVIQGAPVWNDIAAGMNITQYYRVATGGNVSFALGGAQDNGTTMVDRNTGISTAIGPGDGMECQVDPVDPSIIYVASQNGSYFKWDIKAGISLSNLNPIAGNIQTTEQGGWTAPLCIDPNDHNRLYAAFNSVFTSPDQGETWKTISSPFTGKIYRLALCKSSVNTLYATEESGKNIHFTHDTGASWTTVTHPYNEQMISDIVVDHNNPKRFWITFPGFGNNKSKVAEYNDGTWKTWNENLPDLPVYCILRDTSNGTMYLGTYTGVYYRTADMNQWEKFSTGMPIASVYDMDFNYKTGEIVAGTWGRGMWASPKYEKEMSIPKGVPYAMHVVEVFPNPSGGSFTIADNEQYFSNKTVDMRIIDVTGKTVWTARKEFGIHTLTVETGVPSGTYILEMTNVDGKTARERIVVR